jgi:signal transduction histidine kinase
VFSNLIGNAVHYGVPDGPVEVEVQESGRTVVVSVHNDGPPIPEAIRAELFSPFRRGERDSRTAETAGLGLGLYISREIVVGHGGDIAVSSRSTEGTTFRVTLPRTSTTVPHDTVRTPR